MRIPTCRNGRKTRKQPVSRQRKAQKISGPLSRFAQSVRQTIPRIPSQSAAYRKSTPMRALAGCANWSHRRRRCEYGTRPVSAASMPYRHPTTFCRPLPTVCPVRQMATRCCVSSIARPLRTLPAYRCSAMRSPVRFQETICYHREPQYALAPLALRLNGWLLMPPTASGSSWVPNGRVCDCRMMTAIAFATPFRYILARTLHFATVWKFQIRTEVSYLLRQSKSPVILRSTNVLRYPQSDALFLFRGQQS